jgi:cation-transporting P-type ATPase 13A2
MQPLQFSGLILFENKLKENSKEVMHNLISATYNTKVISGDNVFTVIKACQDCNIIQPQIQVNIIEKVNG